MLGIRSLWKFLYINICLDSSAAVVCAKFHCDSLTVNWIYTYWYLLVRYSQLGCPKVYVIDGLVQDGSISTANALDILQSCTKPSICIWLNWWTSFLRTFKIWGLRIITYMSISYVNISISKFCIPVQHYFDIFVSNYNSHMYFHLISW